MAKKDFMPDADPALLQWLGILKTQAVAQPTSVLAAAQLTALTATIDHLVGKIQAADAAESAYHAAVQVKNAAKKTDVAAIRTFIQTFKHSPAYTEAIGKALGIVGEEHATDFDLSKPLPKVKKTQKGVEIKYSKSGTDGAFVYCKRGTETDFSRLEKVTQSVYTDARPNLDGAAAEIREYYLVYFVKDEPVGLDSDVVSLRT
jgi:hypothetical protein